MSVPLLQTPSGSLVVRCAMPVEHPRIDASSSTADGSVKTWCLRDPVSVLGDYKSRQILIEHAGEVLPEAGQIAITLDGMSNVSAIICRGSGQRHLCLSACPNADLAKLTHPLANLLPSLDEADGYIITRHRQGARLAYLDEALEGPFLWDGASEVPHHYSTDEGLLQYLGRTVADGTSEDGLGSRFVEPGVGRSCLVDFLSLKGHHEFVDFSASGIGLTQYSAGGYVAIGRNVDGQVALKRAHHRRLNAERLETAGCRAGRVVAIVELPNQWVTMLDGSLSPAVVMVRAFRTVLRVKQLDPIASFYHSAQHGARVATLLMEQLAEEGSRLSVPHSAASVAYASRAAVGLESFAASSDDFQRVLGLTRSGASSGWEVQAALKLRQRLLAAYAPLLLGFARHRVASAEFQPSAEPQHLSTEAYVLWFAESLGAQLARMRMARFLHDYHHAGVSRYRPDWLYTLVELNVTVSAEFADLETGVFVESPVEEITNALQLSTTDVQTLRSNFETFHETDVAMARRVVLSLATAGALAGELPSTAVERATGRFDESYHATVSDSK